MSSSKTSQRKTVKLNKLNKQYSPKSIGATAPVPSNGHCTQSPVGAHWWLIETQDGQVSVGVCRYCRTERGFLNWLGLEWKR